MYDLILRDIEEVFGSASWTTNNIRTYPMNYLGNKDSNSEYVLMNVLPSSSSNYAFGVKKETNGLVAVKIFVKAGDGQGRLMAIANLLDTVLDNKTLSNGTKLGTSYLNVEGLDPSNKALYSASYIIPFTHYGE
jgi:hypothetical protein